MNADGDVDCVKKVIKDNKFSAFNQQNEIYRFSLTCFIYLHLKNIFFSVLIQNVVNKNNLTIYNQILVKDSVDGVLISIRNTQLDVART